MNESSKKRNRLISKKERKERNGAAEVPSHHIFSLLDLVVAAADNKYA